MKNKFYFDYSISHPEDMLDQYYAKDMVVIPKKASENSELIENNSKLLDLITDFQVENEYKTKKNDIRIKKIIDEIITILDTTKNIHFSPFCQFFMVYNFNFSVYQKCDNEEKVKFIFEILKKYCKERHSIYKNHAYTNSILQVMCDNYSHKRNSRTTIDKFEDLLKPYISHRLKDENLLLMADDYFFEPDKGDKALFDQLLVKLDIKMISRETEQEKLPDMIFKHSDNYYIFELKSMKESGGGQNKQVVELINFIRFSEQNTKIHYGVFLDSLYANNIFIDKSPKITKQRNAIIEALEFNKGNYFFNTMGAKKFLKDLFK